MAKSLKERLGVKEIIDQTDGRKPQKGQEISYFIFRNDEYNISVAYKVIGNKPVKQPWFPAPFYYFDI